MDPSLSIIMANMAHAREGTLMYDPFAGTGSLLICCSHFGAYTVGTDISPPVLRGAEAGKNVMTNMDQYGLKDRLAGLICLDTSRTNLIRRPLFDAIVCDPPYGVRAGARKVGKKETSSDFVAPTHLFGDGVRIPQCVAYSVSEMLADLLTLAGQILVMHGRLVFWLPTTYEFKDSDIPQHACFELVGNSEQPISTVWARRLITMEKVKPYDPSYKVIVTEANPAHTNFAKKVFHDPMRRDDGDVGLRDLDELRAQAKHERQQQWVEARRQKLKMKKKLFRGDREAAVSSPSPTPEHETTPMSTCSPPV
eukprot:TRINITY_DN1563_c0_g1_i1.p1 TRINITY_DN1563_c0_g1~~TRINITY_DN1563_c0_g1_i1.p1  ORF type:complete len:309 (+),score=76.26 TRINITY_DN1563_c0_g1_i1:863-1789(+)